MVDGIGGSLDPDRSTLGHLVGEGVGQRLGRVGAVHLVAVAVHQAVQLAQRERAVPGQDRETGRAEVTAGERERVGRDRGERRLGRAGRAPAVGVVDRGPEPFVDDLDLVEDLAAVARPLEGVAVVHGQGLDESALLGVQVGTVRKVPGAAQGVEQAFGADGQVRMHGAVAPRATVSEVGVPKLPVAPETGRGARPLRR